MKRNDELTKGAEVIQSTLADLKWILQDMKAAVYKEQKLLEALEDVRNTKKAIQLSFTRTAKNIPTKLADACKEDMKDNEPEEEAYS